MVLTGGSLRLCQGRGSVVRGLFLWLLAGGPTLDGLVHCWPLDLALVVSLAVLLLGLVLLLCLFQLW